jgi:hypothetical protein
MENRDQTRAMQDMNGPHENQRRQQRGMPVSDQRP